MKQKDYLKSVHTPCLINPMKAKTIAEIGLTAIVLFFIYKAVTREEIVESLQNKVIDREMVAATGVSASEAMGTQTGGSDSFTAASGEKDVEVLKALARGEADNMVKTGDVSAYQEELAKNPLLRKITGQ